MDCTACPSGDKFVVLFAPGNCASLSQAARYHCRIPADGKDSSDGTMSYAACGHLFCNAPLHCVEFAEHMNQEDLNIFLWMLGWVVGFFRSCITGIWPVWVFLVNPFRINLGQSPDVALMEAAYQEMMAKKEVRGKKILVMAVSRGGQATLTWLAKHPHPEVSGVIIEGGLVDFNDLIYCSWGRKQRFYRTARWLLTTFGSHERYGPTALRYVQDIKKDLPMLIVNSNEDDVIHMQGAYELQAEMNKFRLQKSRMVTLRGAGHNEYISHPFSRLVYQDAVREFLDKNGFV